MRKRLNKKDSILTAVCFRSAPEELIGLAEIYNYEEEKKEAVLK